MLDALELTELSSPLCSENVMTKKSDIPRFLIHCRSFFSWYTAHTDSKKHNHIGVKKESEALNKLVQIVDG